MELAIAVFALVAGMFLGGYITKRLSRDYWLNLGDKDVPTVMRDVCEAYLKSRKRKLLEGKGNVMGADELAEEFLQELRPHVERWFESEWVRSVDEFMQRDRKVTEEVLRALGHNTESPYAPLTDAVLLQQKASEPAAE